MAWISRDCDLQIDALWSDQNATGNVENDLSCSHHVDPVPLLNSKKVAAFLVLLLWESSSIQTDQIPTQKVQLIQTQPISLKGVMEPGRHRTTTASVESDPLVSFALEDSCGNLLSSKKHFN